jgi:hypothetical protein
MLGANGPPTHHAVYCQPAIAHLASAGPAGGHVGSAGLSVHRSVLNRSWLIETAAKLGAPECKVLLIMNPATTAPIEAAFATMPIARVRSVGHFITITTLTSLRPSGHDATFAQEPVSQFCLSSALCRRSAICRPAGRGQPTRRDAEIRPASSCR